MAREKKLFLSMVVEYKEVVVLESLKKQGII